MNLDNQSFNGLEWPENNAMAKLSKPERAKFERILSWWCRHAHMHIEPDDDRVRKIMTAQGVPGLEAIPGDLPEGGGRPILANDGTYAYAFGVWTNHEDQKENGYAMIRLDTKPLAAGIRAGLYTELEAVRAVFMVLGFSGSPEHMSTLKFWQPASNN